MSFDYKNRDIQADVALSKLKCKAYLDDLIVTSDRRRKERNVPVLALCGPGRCGKDLGADWLGNNFCVDYGGSLSEIVAPLIASVMNAPTQDVFAARHSDRLYWFEFCNELRRHDPRYLVRLLLAKADIVVGMRGAIELEACHRDGLINLAVWINNNRAKPDPTIEFESADCDITIENCTNKLAYFNKLDKLANTLKLPPRLFRATIGITA
jgi:hypothetical protein